MNHWLTIPDGKAKGCLPRASKPGEWCPMLAERIEAIIGRLMSRPAYGHALSRQSIDEQSPKPESIEAILRAVDAGWGGAAGWLLDHGRSTYSSQFASHRPEYLSVRQANRKLRIIAAG